MPKDTNVVETSNANKVFDIPVKLEPGQINTLSFSQDSISEMRQLPKGELEISFRDGSKVVVENFDELVNSAQSCGRDTIIQLSDNTIIYPEELAAKLNAGPVNFALATDTSGAILLSAPKPGQIIEKNIESGLEYKLDFSFNDTASAAQAGNNLIITFKDGGVLVLNNYYTAMGSELPPPMTLADGSVIDSNALLTSCKLVEVPAIAEAMAGKAGAPDVEPAAGEEEVAQAQTQRAGPPKQAAPDVEPAAGDESVANIEPAAGDAGNAPSSSGRGYGFGSSIDAAALNGANPVGPIGATLLAYSAEFPDPRLARGVAAPFVDTNPELNGATNAVDETNLSPNVVSGNVGVNYNANGAGSLAFNPTFVAGGSLAGGALTSHGNPVTVTLSGNTYTGTANGVTVFTITLDPATGNYTFTQNAALDHQDGTNPNDLITLSFGITATDSDGDTVSNTILIGVYDDAPIAKDDVDTVGSDPLTVTGSVTANDYLGHDASTPVTQVVFNGTVYVVPAVGTVSIAATYGTLTIAANGDYTYTSNNTADGTDVFTYTIVDFDGDPSSANLSITVTDIDTVPSVTPSVCPLDESNLAPGAYVSGSVGADWKDDGPGTFTFSTFTSGGSKLGGNLTSGGVPITVALENGVYVGKAGGTTVFTITLNPATGAYTYTQWAALDHADGSNPNDVITLQFGVNATDADGDSTPTTITIEVLDDAPVAVNDSNTVNEGTLTAVGNVLDNDDANNDGHGHVTEITFNGSTVAVPAVGTVTIAGTFGTLTIGANGAYTYTSFNTAVGTDVFTYGMKDFDGDKATATLTLTIADIDTKPVVGDDTKTVDETDLGPNVVDGKVPVDFGADNPGSIKLTNFEVGGSVKGGELSSCGDKITVSLVNGAYVGIDADGATIFTLTLNADGTYKFTQFKGLDHADPNNPDDVITLKFTVTGTDSDGDTDTGVITINVKDDGPVANDDHNTFDTNVGTTNGNVISGLNGGAGAADVKSEDGGNHVTKVTYKGVDYPVPASGEATINGDYGVLKIKADGSYTYTLYNNGGTPGTGTGGAGEFSETLTFPTVGEGNPTFNENSPNEGIAPGALHITSASNGSVTVLSETAGYSNTLGLYTIGADGTIQAVQIVSANVNELALGGKTNFEIPGNGNGVGFFLIADGYTLNGGYAGKDLSTGNLVFYYNYGQPDQRLAKVTDGAANITLVHADNGVETVISSPVYHTTDRDGSNALNPDGSVHTISGLAHDGDTSTLRIGFEDLPNQGDKDFSDVVFDFTFTPDTPENSHDEFEYTLTDCDGDSDTAIIVFDGKDLIDDQPIISVDPAVKAIDETYLGSGPQEVHGTVTANFGHDGPGTITLSGATSFAFSGSTNGTLTSGGVPVVVTLVGNQYVGKAGSETIFTLTLNSNGTYSYVQTGVLDHADTNNPDDVITLNFGVTATDSDGDKATAVIKVNVHDDGPVASNDTNTVASAPGTVSGNVTANDNVGQDTPGYVVKQVTFGGTVYNVPATGTLVINGAHGTLTIDKTGEYSYKATSVGSDVFTYQIVDYDGDKASATLTLSVADIDTVPTATPSICPLDESNMAPGAYVSGSVGADWKADGPGTFSFTTFTSGGSKLGGALTSGGVPITVSLENGVYVGKAGATTVFTITLNTTTGGYTYTQWAALDHADGSNPNDVISLQFGVNATDSDGDTAPTTITINVLDDAPVAVDDVGTVNPATLTVSGNVLANDDANNDGHGRVTEVTFNGTTIAVPATGTVSIVGTYGTLVIGANGAYTYTSKNTAAGSDVFTYGMKDFDGDKATAKLTLTINDIDTCPTVENVTRVVDETDLNNAGTQTLTGAVVVNYGADGPGTVSPSGAGSFTATGSVAGGSLKSNGFAVTVTLSGDTYTGTSSDGRAVFTLQVKADGTYTFKLLDQLDHADKTNPDDIISLNFGFTAKDTDDDSASGRITINVKDDGPVAVNDTNTVASAPGSVSANVLVNDKAGADAPAVVKQVTFGTTTVDVPTSGTITIAGAHGTLTIGANGAYTYNATSNGSDVFTYKIVDFDGDPATATLTLTVTDIDTTPCIENSVKVIDETALAGGPLTVNGTLVVDYLADGPGQTTPAGAGTFTAGGSLAGGMLTSHGYAIGVTLAGDTYTGKSSDGRTIFTLTIKTDGTYSFTLVDQLDHADKTNPNDIISLNFGVLATDTDGDSMAANITINVKDDAPIAVNDVNSVGDVPATVTGNILSNDTFGQDTPGALTKIGFNGTFVAIPSTGTVTLAGAHGTLTIKADGTYSYTGTSAGVDQFTYSIVDYDGDTATANLTITVNDLNTCPTVANAVNVVDETIMNDNGNVQTVNGNLVVDYKADGPGSTAPTTASTFTSGGSLAGGALTSLGFAVAVTLAGNTYTGKSADGRTIFTLEVKSDATYTFKLLDQLDHADKTNPDDIISLNFGFKATDADGDAAEGKITINVKDDGPVAADDTATLAEAPGSVSGNVLTNDDAGADKPGAVKSVTFGSTTVDVPAAGTVTINGAHGTLTIAANGNYTYTGASVGADQFTYKMVDSDGDPATAKLTITVEDADECPTVVNAAVVLDETNLVPAGHSVSGTTSPNFFGDGPGTVKAAGAATFLAGGSLKDGVLKSDGVGITVTLNTTTNTYEGFAGARKVFDIKINDDGTFKFTQFDNIDHGNPANTNEAITLKFGVIATDADGDTAQGTITVTILDDAPIARDDFYSMVQNQVVQNGNVLTNDTIGNDYTANAVTAVKLGANTYTVPNAGSVTVVGTYGTLVLNSNGSYTYTAKAGAQGTELFTYTITDTDLDTSTAQLKFDVKNSAPPECPVVRAEDLCVLEDSCVAVNVTATQVGGNGNEVMTLTISGFKPGWTVDTSTSGGTYNAGTGVWTITLAPGQNYHGGPTIYPPHNSDVDMNNLVVKATTYDPDNGLTSPQGTDSFNVTTDAVADMPTLNVDGDDTLTNVANLYISSAVTDQDGSEVIKEIQIGGVPAGWSLTNGHYDAGTGKWILSVAELNGLKLIAPHNTVATVDLTVTSVAEEKYLSDNEALYSNNLAYHTKTLTVSFADTCGCGLTTPESPDGGTVIIVDNHNTNTVTGTNTSNVVVNNTNVVTITDFDAAEGDVLDFSNMIENHDPVSQAINDFVFARSEGHNTVISVDTHGSGAASQAQDVVILQDVTGVKVEDVTVISTTNVA